MPHDTRYYDDHPKRRCVICNGFGEHAENCETLRPDFGEGAMVEAGSQPRLRCASCAENGCQLGYLQEMTERDMVAEGEVERWRDERVKLERDEALAELKRLREHADALAGWVEFLCEHAVSTPALIAVARYRDA